MEDFDAAALWNELQREEKQKRCKLDGKNNKQNAKFWRHTTIRKYDKSNQHREYKFHEKGNKHNNKIHATKKNTKIHSIKHAINILNDQHSSNSKRLHTLQCINKYLNNNNMIKMDSMEILKNIIKIFVDPSEPLRCLSIDIISTHIGNENKIWNYSNSIKYIIPIIVHCVLSDEYQEKSEEIRLKFVNLLEIIIKLSQNEDQIKPICGDLISILMKLLNDDYYTINKKVCCVIILLSKKIRLHNISKNIIETSLNLLSHRHSAVRISAIELIECMLMNGGHEAIRTLTGFREYNNVPLIWWFGNEIRTNYFGALCRHQKHSVRDAFYKMIINVMTNMTERYDYKTLLLSYLLSGLQDKDTKIQINVFDAIEAVGKMHQEDEYNNLKKTLFFEKEAEEITKKHFEYDDEDTFELPFPFKCRPCLGARVLIREHFKRILNAVLSEFSDWKNDCKQMAMLLVRNMIIYSEEYCTQDTEQLIKSFHDYIHQNEIAKQCCTLIGRYVYPIIWIDYLSEMMYHEFDIEWIIVLNQLISHCPVLRLNQVTKQIVALMEYAIPRISIQNEETLSPIIMSILQKLKKTLEKCGDYESERKDEEDGDFQFSSEYRGFHLEIVDKTQDDELSVSDQKNMTLKERIDTLLQK